MDGVPFSDIEMTCLPLPQTLTAAVVAGGYCAAAKRGQWPFYGVAVLILQDFALCEVRFRSDFHTRRQWRTALGRLESLRLRF